MIKHFCILQLLFVQLCLASITEYQHIEERATLFLRAHQQSTKILNVDEFHVNTVDDLQSCYLVRYNEPAFVLVDKYSDKILGFSTEDDAQGELPPAFQRILASRSEKQNTAFIQSSGTLSIPSSSYNVGPLLTTKWHQNDPYSTYCPQKVPVGCVALGLAQIMNFYEWPLRGCGEHSYETSTYQFSVYADFNQNYNWANMPSYLPRNALESEYADLANLLFDVGAAMEMDYNVSGSAASPAEAILAMQKYFAYSDDMSLRCIWDEDIAWNESLWIEAIRNELLQNRPILYAAESDLNTTAHAFVIDGLKDETFHINWGWGGSYDGNFSYNFFRDFNDNPNFISHIQPKCSQAYFDVDRQSGFAPLTVRFQNYSFARQDDILSYQWDFGDGTSSTLVNPQHTFSKPGAYNVKLILFSSTGSDTLVQPSFIKCISSRTLAHVAPSGSDKSGDGSLNLPFASIQHAINTCDDGDTVLVDNGVYHENLNFWGKSILVASKYLFSKEISDIHHSIIDADNNGSVVVCENGEDEHTILQGFTLKNGSGANIVPNWLYTIDTFTCGGAIMCRNQSGPTLKDLLICNNTARYGAAVYCEDQSYPQIYNSHIFNNGFENGGDPQQILFSIYSDLTIKDSFYYHNKTWQQPEVRLESTCATFVNSIFALSDNEAMSAWNINDASSLVVNHCTLWGNARNYISNHASTIAMNNSIIWNFPQPGMHFSETRSPSLIVNYCDIQFGQDFCNETATGTFYWQQGNMNTNPMFLDPHNLDFSLMITSPCRQAADPQLIEYADMGANLDYEFLNVLPVELAGFFSREQEHTIALQWHTLSETNNLGFEIERRTENSEYEKIGFVRGNGTVNSTFYYEFTDPQPAVGVNFYRLKQIDTNGEYSYSQELQIENVIQDFQLLQNYPNPFNAATTIDFVLPQDKVITLKIFNLNGQLLKTLINKKMQAGLHSVQWNGSDRFGRESSSGLYFYEMRAGSFCKTGRMFLIK